MDKMTCNGCGKVGHIKRFCKSKEKKDENETTTQAEPSTKGLFCYLKRSASLPTALHCTMTAAVTSATSPTSTVILDCGATHHFFCSREYFTTYVEHYHEFKTGSGEILAAYGYGNVRLTMIQQNKETNIIDLSNVSWAPDLGHNLVSTVLLAF